MLLEIFILLLAHWVGDFLLQKESWAVTKHNNFTNLLNHANVYALTVGLFVAGWMLFNHAVAFAWIPLILFTLVTSILHTAVDFVTSKVNHKLYNAGNMRTFYKVIGFDQLVHSMAVLLTFDYLICKIF